MENKRCVRCGMKYPDHKMSCKIPVEEWRLPTAEEWLEDLPLQTLTDELKEDIIDAFYADKIEFAKMHVEAALKAAANEYYPKDKENFELIAERFINAYPSDLIK